MKRIAVALVASMVFAGSAAAQMRQGMMPDMMPMQMPMPMGMMQMGEQMGPDMMEMCMMELGEFGLPAETLKALEDKRFELRSKAIRGMAELMVLKLEAGRLLENRNFDAKSVEGKLSEISRREAELRALHLGFLRELGSALTDEQWKKLRSKRTGGMPMMDGMMKGGMINRPMMDGMMKGGMMMGQPPEKGGDPSGHHPGPKEDASKFFEEKR